MEVHWLLCEDVIQYNRDVIIDLTPQEDFGVRDYGLLESALQRGNMVHYYDQTSDIFDIAAAIGFGLVKNHPFMNGNKRTAYVATGALLLMNGYWLRVEQSAPVAMFQALALGTKTETCLAHWLRANSADSEAF